MGYGLLGEHLSHSYSPMIHGQLGDYAYDLFEVAPEALDSFMTSGTFDGLNVTIPYKKAVMPYCAELSDTARAMGCVNTIVRRPDGTLYGDNTDAAGFTWLLDRNGGIGAGEKALVLGSGGAAGTVCRVLESRGARVVQISRQGEKTHHTENKFAADGAAIGQRRFLGLQNHGITPLLRSESPRRGSQSPSQGPG